jgi:hypothetical protein
VLNKSTKVVNTNGKNTQTAIQQTITGEGGRNYIIILTIFEDFK